MVNIIILLHSGRQPGKRKNYMKKPAKKKSPTADEIAELAMKGDDVSKFFTNKGEMRPPIQRVNVDFTLDMLKELDDIAKKMNISRQAMIKSYLRQALDQHYLAKQRHGKTMGFPPPGKSRVF
jgi:hypothetical protein